MPKLISPLSVHHKFLLFICDKPLMHCEYTVHHHLLLVFIEKRGTLKSYLPILETDLGG